MNKPAITASKSPGTLGSIVILLFALVLLIHGSWAMYNTYQSPSFVEVPARVVDTDRYSSTTGSRTTTYGTWYYQYTFEGKTYQDSARQYGQYEDRMQQYPKGSTMPIYINPAFPSKSQLHNERSWGSIILFFGEWLVGAGLLFGLTALLRDRFFPTLHSLDQAVATPGRVRKADLRNQRLTRLPDSISRFERLTSLDVSHNALTDLPESLRDLRHLHHLNLRYNNFRTLPAVLFELPGLKTVDLQNNPLNKDSISALSRLSARVSHSGEHGNTTFYDWDDARSDPRVVEVLYLTDKRLSAIGPEIGDMSDLRELHLNGNQLTDLPKELAKLTRLQVLNVSRNALTHIPAPVFQLKNLRCLDASYNHIQTFRFPSSPLKCLTELSLAGNPLKELDLPGACPLEKIDLCETSFPDTETSLLKQRFKHASISVSLNPEAQAITDAEHNRLEVQARTRALEHEVEIQRNLAERERQQALAAAQAQAEAEMARTAEENAARQAALQAEIERVEREQADMSQANPEQQAALKATTGRLEEEVKRRLQAMATKNDATGPGND